MPPVVSDVKVSLDRVDKRSLRAVLFCKSPQYAFVYRAFCYDVLHDDGLRCLHEAVLRDIGRSCAFDRGAGAAGGMGYGAAVFFGAELKMGIDIVLNAVDFDSIVGDADCVFTGEGRLDAQSLGGKVVVGVARAAKKHGVPVIAVVGDVGGGIDSVYDEGVSAVFSINRTAVPYSEARLRAKGDLFRTVEDIIRLIKISE